tara:strand:- start:246 stop:884 length:639 start_codon:yes stop_codon:yes gene_type:complete
LSSSFILFHIQVLDVILIDTAIIDQNGKKFWRRHFFQRDQITWRELESTLWQCYLPTYVFIDGNKNAAELKADLVKKMECLRGVLLDMQFAPDGQDDFISMEKLGFVLTYFGPMLDGKGQIETFLSNLFNIVSKDWFFGNVEQATACGHLSDSPIGSYLVRYSTSAPGYFTISTRVVPNEDQQDNLNNHYMHRVTTIFSIPLHLFLQSLFPS